MKTIETRIKYYVDYDGIEHFVPQVLIPEPYEKPRNLIEFLPWLFYALGKSVHDLFVKPVWKSLYVRVPRKIEKDENGKGIIVYDFDHINDKVELYKYDQSYKTEECANFVLELFLKQEEDRRNRKDFKPKEMYI